MSYDAYNSALNVYKTELEQFEKKRKREIILDLAKMLEVAGYPTEMISQKLSDDLQGYISSRHIREVLEELYKSSSKVRQSAANADNNHTEASCISMDENDYRRVRPQVLARDNFKCTECGERKDLEIHHKKKTNGLSLDHDIDNLKTLCKKCHGKQTRSETADSPHRPHKLIEETEKKKEILLTNDGTAASEDETLADEDDAPTVPHKTQDNEIVAQLKARVAELEEIELKRVASDFKPAAAIPAENKTDELFLSMDHWSTMFMIMRNGEKKGFWCKHNGKEILSVEANYVRAKAQAQQQKVKAK